LRDGRVINKAFNKLKASEPGRDWPGFGPGAQHQAAFTVEYQAARRVSRIDYFLSRDDGDAISVDGDASVTSQIFRYARGGFKRYGLPVKPFALRGGTAGGGVGLEMPF